MKNVKNFNSLKVFEYLKSLKSKGIYLYVEEGILKYKAKNNVLLKEILNDIKSNKEDITEFLMLAKDNYVDLSSLQLAYMAGQSKTQVLNKVNAHYYIEYSKENIDVSKLENALNILIRENDALRMIILSSGHGLIIDEMPRYRIQTYNLVNGTDRLSTRENLSHKRYFYDSWPMFTIVVGKSDKFEDVFHFSFDCSILDAWCAGKMVNNLFKIYSGQKPKQTEYTYKDYTYDLKSYKEKNKKIIQKAEQYWENRILAISDSPELKYNKSFNELQTTTFSRQEFSFEKGVVKALEKYSKLHKVTLTSIVMTIYMITLSNISSRKNISINITVFGKLPLNKNVDEILGEFTNNGLIEYKDENDDFVEAVKSTQKQIFKLLEFRAYDGVNILNKAKISSLGKQRYFPIVMTCMIGENYNSVINGFKEEYSLSQTPQVALDHHVRIIDGTMKITFDYIEELFNKNQIQELIYAYKEKIDSICKGNMGGSKDNE
ncbi:condensation domain-containing protein [Enterococcus faecalis]|uniref:condensation domain-containing protein n=1 Tax=Enterococcus faecalis TaxID=1351 RepID=UPI00317105AA